MKKILIILVIILLCSCSNKKLDINSKLVNELYNVITPSEDANVLRYKYGNYNGFHNNYILAVALKNYLDKQSLEVKTIPKKDIENIISEIFGTNITFTHNKTYLLTNNICGFDYNKNLEQYELIDGCGGNNTEKFYHKITEVKENNMELRITEKVIYTVYSDDLQNVSIYNDIYNKNLLEEVVATKEIKIEDFLEKASTYEYIFMKNSKTYILKDIILK